MSDPSIETRILASGLPLSPDDRALLAVAVADVDRQSARLRGYALSVGEEPAVTFAVPSARPRSV